MALTAKGYSFDLIVLNKNRTVKLQSDNNRYSKTTGIRLISVKRK